VQATLASGCSPPRRIWVSANSQKSPTTAKQSKSEFNRGKNLNDPSDDNDPRPIFTWKSPNLAVMLNIPNLHLNLSALDNCFI
jgi:hypothetical protein